jgi:hypothetical protein
MRRDPLRVQFHDLVADLPLVTEGSYVGLQPADHLAQQL